MYEDRTAVNILDELLDSVSIDIYKEEGSIIHTALAAAAEKLEDAYIDIATTYDNCFADTADREHLIRKAAERGLKPNPATHAIYKGAFNCNMSVGDRFSHSECNFIIIAHISNFNYELKCEQIGVKGNNCFGELSYLGYNKEFEKGELTELLIPAKDEQGTEEFREDYFNDVTAQTFAGNIPAYIKEVNKLDGVGASKVIQDGEGAVKIIIINAEYERPSDALVNYVQDVIDPDTDINNYNKEYGLPELIDYKGKGYGLAPINHFVLVEGIKNVHINITTNIVLKEEYKWDNVENSIHNAIDEYFERLRREWKEISNVIVRKSYIEAAILDVEGILDITRTLINESETITLKFDEIPIRGSVVNE